MATTASAPDRLHVSEADELFAALDRRVISKGVTSWVVAVLRIHYDEREWWIDIASDADASMNVIIRASRRATAAHALAALHAWHPDTQQPTPIIDVMRCSGAT
jgi:leucyl-tRNA synthetase